MFLEDLAAVFRNTDITYLVYSFEYLALIWSQGQCPTGFSTWLLDPITNQDVSLSSGTTGTGVWAEKLPRRTQQSNLKKMKDIIIWDFSCLSHHEGEKRSQHQSSKQKSGGNYCGQETKGDMAVYPLVSREATELFRKGTRSNARVRNCRLRPRSSRS